MNLKSKTFLSLIIPICLALHVQGQSNRTFQKEGSSYLDVSEVINLFEMNDDQLDQLLKNLGYSSDVEGEITIYQKGSLGENIQAIAKSKQLTSIEWWEWDASDPVQTLKNFEPQFKDYFVAEKNGISYYNYQKYTIGISKTSAEGIHMEKVLITVVK